MMIKRHTQKSGFTLVELSIAIIVIGLLSAVLLNLYSTYIKQKGLADTKSGSEFILKSLAAYAAKNGRYPCPANSSSPSSSVEFGAEDCAGTATATGTAGASVLIGSIPFRTLNIPAQRIIDGYGNRYTYAVTADLTSSSVGVGAISLIDSNRESVITPPGSAPFAIVSHGESGHGAYNYGGGRIDCPDLASAKDAENCNGDAVFMIADYSAGNNSNKYDDVVSYNFTDANVTDTELGRYDIATITWMTHSQGDAPSTSVSTSILIYDTAYACFSKPNEGEPTGLDYNSVPPSYLGHNHGGVGYAGSGINIPVCAYGGATPLPPSKSGRYKLSVFETQADGGPSGNSTVPSTKPSALLIDTKFGCVISDYTALKDGPKDPQSVISSPYLGGFPTCAY